MPASLICACVWALTACFAGMAPRRFHWPAAWILILTGIPLLGWVTWQAGPFWGLLLFIASASVLRWPIIRGWQAMQRAVASSQPSDPGQ